MLEGKCKYFSECGACQIQGVDKSEYLSRKESYLRNILKDLNCESFSPMITFPSGIRRRALLKVDYGCNIGFFKGKSNDIVPIQRCPLLKEEINALITPLKKLFKTFVKRSDGEIDISLLDNGIAIHFDNVNLMPLDYPKIKDFCEQYQIVRLSAGNKEIYKREEPFVMFNEVKVSYPFKSFLQPSVEGQNAIVQLIVDKIKERHFANVADIFSGLGLFSFYLKDFSDKVVAFDCDEDAIKNLNNTAKFYNLNIKGNQVDLFKKPIKAEGLNQFDLIVMDPPRSGAFKQSIEIAKSNVKNVIYVSCNPLTFKDDALELIKGGYKILNITPIDQFPNTKHLEIVAMFEKN